MFGYYMRCVHVGIRSLTIRILRVLYINEMLKFEGTYYFNYNSIGPPRSTMNIVITDYSQTRSFNLDFNKQYAKLLSK